MSRYPVILLLALALSACASAPPPNHPPFRATTTLVQLEGVYENKGDGGTDHAPTLYLSSILWPDDDSLDHHQIERIAVDKQSENTLQIRALRSGEIVRKKELIEGQDFKIEDGVIVLSSEAGIAGLKTGEPLLGFYGGSSKLGLDVEGHGKFHSSGTAAGLAFLVFPVAASYARDVRFRRRRLYNDAGWHAPAAIPRSAAQRNLPGGTGDNR